MPRHLAFAAAYFGAAALPIATTRLDGGVSLVWIATALLTAKLRTTARSRWPWWLAAAGLASVLATGLFGLGWTAAPAMMVLNLLDALVAERVLSMAEARRGAGPVELRGPAIVVACLAGAVATMVPAGAVTTMAAGTPFVGNVANWVIGHTLGSLTFGPLMFFCMRGQMRPWIGRLLAGRDLQSLTAVVVLVFACVLAFSAPNFSLLFLPVLALTFLTYRAGLQGAAFGSVLLGAIGTAFTVAGHLGSEFGPPAVTFQFFQFFLGMTMLAMLPMSAVISARKDMAERLRHSEAGYRLLADNIDDVVVGLDLKGRLTYVSPSIRNFAGQQPGDVVGRSGLDLVEPSFHDVVRKAYSRMLGAGGAPVAVEFLGATGDEHRRWFELQGRRVSGAEGAPDSIVAAVRETTARKMLEAALASAAEKDTFTGLLNRRAFLDAARTTAQSGVPCCLALFDLDHLEAINTMLGSDAGDQALLTFAEVSRRIVRECDLLGRFEGDTFGLLLPNASREEAAMVCTRLLAAFAGERMRYDGRPVAISASAGLAVLQDDVEASTRIAHSALALAKEGGRGRVRLAA
jgi:diguanylate cyclase (GGDEF)-like protein/PAS domain S-box-containing protein